MSSEGEPRELEGYDGKYRVFPEGRVERRTATGYVRVAEFGDPPRVTLFRLGTRWQPYVHVLLDRVGFGV